MKWESAWIRGGRIKEVVWLNREIIVWCSGIHIIFFHLTSGEETIFSCPPSVDGVCCITGHPTMDLIAFAEMSRNPRILIYSYPEMELMSECRRGPESGYLATAFASSEYLISLGSWPIYPIIIWNWKNATELHSIPSPIHDLYGQMIRVSLCRPMLLAQLGRDSGKLIVWSVITTSTIVMSYKEITLPNEATAVYVDWSPPKENVSQLLIADEHGHVYIFNKDSSEVNRVVFSQRCGVCLDYEIPIVCWFQNGIILKTTFCQIRYFKKNSRNVWRRVQYIESELKPYIITVNPFKSDELFYFTEEGFLIQLNLSTTNENTLKVDKKINLGGIYIFIDFIYPWAHDLITIDMNFDLNIVDVTNGEIVGTLNLKTEGKVNYLLSHPDFPLAALITVNGELFIVRVHERHNPSILFKYQLQSEQLDFLKFSQCGRHLIVGEKTSGICFCITSTSDSPFSKIYQLDVDREIVDVGFYDENGVLKIMVLILSSTVSFIGNYIFMYKLLPNEENFIQTKFITQLPTFYQRIHYAPENSKIMVATPYLSRQIHFFNRTLKMKMSLIRAVKATGQQVRGIKIHTNRRYITASGVDGVVTVVTGQADTETPTILSTHHRRDLGVSKAIRSPSGSIVIALGRNGSVVCVRLKLNGEFYVKDEAERQQLIKSDYQNLNENIFRYLSGPYQIIPSQIYNAKTWTEWMKQQIFLREEEQCREKKLDIIKRLDEMKVKIQKMLDKNEKCSDNEKLPIAAFDLAILLRKQKMKLAREEREDLRLKLEFECASMNKVSDWIKKTFWDPLKVLPKSIFSIFDDKEITNYPTTPDDPQEKEMIAWNDYLIDTNVDDEYSSPELERCLLIKNRYKPTRMDEKALSFIENLSIDDGEYEKEDENEAEQRACEGNTTYKFIPPSSQYSQFEDYTFPQFISMTTGMASDIQQLKDYFNELFEKMYEMKQQEVALFCERNEKIYHINSELKILFNQTVPEILIDPKWHYQEHPESIVTVMDDEVMAKPYISVSQQELARKQAEEAEKERLLLLADDFREKKLLEMMDGVLEVRWENVIKKDIPKPECMLTKSPDDYNVEDILAVKKYENDVQSLMQEREKYRTILEADYLETMKIIKKEVEKFDSSLQEFSLTKMKIESAIKQINLMRVRGYIKAFHRLERHRIMDDCHQKINGKKNQIQKILEQNHFLHSLLSDLKSHREQLLYKETMMLKKVKKEFRSLSKVVIELLRRQYKRRPKVVIKNASARDFLELGNCITTNTDFKFLNHHCAEYLAGVKANDIQPSNLPELITSHDWTHLIEVRRNKIELEMNLKANWMEINETECGIADNNKNIEKLERDICDLNDRLRKINQDQQISDINSEIQLVLTMGQVEIDQSGQIEETKNAVLMPVEEIQKINNKILEAADKKLKAMKRSIKFNRGYLLKEWQDKCMKMTIANLQEDLREVQNFPVTKDIRAYLQRQEMGLKEDTTVQQLERQLHATETIYQKSLKHWVKKLEDIESKIETIKMNNYALDNEITNMNVDRWEMVLKRDLEAEDRHKKFKERKLALLTRRSKLVLEIQQGYVEYLALKNEYEILQSKKCPELTVKALGDKCSTEKC